MAVQVPLAGSYSSALVRDGAVTSSCHQHLAVGQQRRRVLARAVLRLPVALQVPLAGSYSSAVVRRSPKLYPPATSTLPLGSNVAVWMTRAVARLPVGLHVPLAGSYSSALLR